MTTRSRCYSELCLLETFKERFQYLSLEGTVGQATFGFDRWLNQQFYTSRPWRSARRDVIVRDNGCDLGIEGFEVRFGLLVHHMNPITPRDIEHGESWIIDPEFLICTSKKTHNGIHFGDENAIPQEFVPRSPGDTKLW